MKKVLLFLISIFLILVIYWVVPPNIKEYKIDNMIINLPSDIFSKKKVYKNAILDDEGKEIYMYQLKYTTIKNSRVIENKFKKFFSNSEKIICNNKEEIYIKKNDVTITSYRIEKKDFITNVYLDIHIGKKNGNECYKIKDYKCIDYRISIPNNFRITPSNFRYLDNSGNIYNIHYEYENDILFKYGNNYYKYLDHLLQFGWISMDDIINYLEYQTEIGNATKNNYFNNNTLYKNKDFSLLKCNAINNKDIYIIDKLDEEINLCSEN